jgi:ribonuclease P/MRP protein subunit POP1
MQNAIKSARYGIVKYIQKRSKLKCLFLCIINSSYAINELAFQSLPRGLRRRAASHNLNRLPARLREKAAHEVM